MWRIARAIPQFRAIWVGEISYVGQIASIVRLDDVIRSVSLLVCERLGFCRIFTVDFSHQMASLATPKR